MVVTPPDGHDGHSGDDVHDDYDDHDDQYGCAPPPLAHLATSPVPKSAFDQLSQVAPFRVTEIVPL